MNNFVITLIAVATMLLYAMPGYILMKTKMLKASSISDFAKILMYMCQPCLTIYSFSRGVFSLDGLVQLLVFCGFAMGIQVLMLVVSFFFFTKVSKEAKMRICSVATSLGNVGFLGVPLLEALLPDHPEAIILSATYSLCMNAIAWTLGCAMISGDKNFISLKKLFVNPASLACIVAIPVYVLNYKCPVEPLVSAITLVAKMSTPMCMIIMGMRLGTMKFTSLFKEKWVYVAIAAKQVIMPLIAFLVVQILPVDTYIKQGAFILSAAPVASMTLNFAEYLDAGQETAANLVLFGTVISIVTIPIMMLLLSGIA